MAKLNEAKKPSNLGKGKVTLVQIAFIVERFLADNNYINTLSALRTEASDLFYKTKGKEVPKGLLVLGDILDEYKCLKEQRMMVDSEKRRVEMAFQGLQVVIRAHHSGGSISLPPSPPLLPPQVVATPNIPFFPTSIPCNGFPPGPDTMTYLRRITKCIKISSPHKACRNCSLEQTGLPAKS